MGSAGSGELYSRLKIRLSLIVCQIFFVSRLEIISDVVSEKARSGKIPVPHRKYRYHIGNTDTTSVFSDTTSEIISNRDYKLTDFT
jgi:hypothetical protein